MPKTIKNRDYYTTSQAAKILSVSPDTVLKWIKAGKIKSHRTLGGHFRIPASELRARLLDEIGRDEKPSKLPSAIHYQYCWEYLAAGGEINPKCLDCITYRSRASRCYELKDLPDGMGCLNILCDTDCRQCEYFMLVNGQALNVLILSRRRRILKDGDNIDNFSDLQIKFADDEYEASRIIQDFRPDYVVVDCALGKNRASGICSSMFNDPRIPVARIILASRASNIGEYCDQEVFGWIRKPFAISELKQCINGVPKIERTT